MIRLPRQMTKSDFRLRLGGTSTPVELTAEASTDGQNRPPLRGRRKAA